jgi:hypothetical protein
MRFSLLFLLACTTRLPPPEAHVEPEAVAADPVQAAREAYARRDWPAFVELQKQAVAANPDRVVERYNLACGYALTGQREAALAELRILLQQGADLGAGADPDFASLQGDPEFEELVQKFDALFPPVHHSERAFWVGERTDLAPEGIAHDPATGRFFVGSMRTGTVFAIQDGVATPFATLKVGEIPVSAIGITVDSKRGRLWAIGTATPQHEAWQDAHRGTTAVLGLDLATGELHESHVRAPGGAGFGFNDLTVAEDGTLYLSGSSVHAVRPGQQLPEPLPLDPPVEFCNGITMGGPDVLYIGTPQGVSRVDLATGKHALLSIPEGVDLRNFDGMYEVGDALVGVQLGVGRWRVVRVDLDGSGTAVIDVQILEQENPEIAGATTGVVVGDELFYIARDLPPEPSITLEAGRAAVWRTKIRP